jgi:hypothetical protein
VGVVVDGHVAVAVAVNVHVDGSTLFVEECVTFLTPGRVDS